MRATTSKKLRKIAQSLELPAKTRYVYAGKLRRRSGWRNEAGEWQEGAPIARPIVMVECFRRAYQEAKKIYLGKPPSVLAPEAETNKTFATKVVDSMKEYVAQN